MLNQNSKKYFFQGVFLFILALILNGAIITLCHAEEENQNITTSTITTTTTDETITPLPTTTIFLKIATNKEIIYSENLTVTACTANDNTTSTSLTVYCGLKQIAQEKNWNITFNDYGDLKFLAQINNYDGADGNWWAFFHNLDFASEALNQYELKENDQIILSYGTFPLKIEVSTSTPPVNSTTTITVKEFGFDTNWNSTWLNSISSTLVINGEPTSTNSGVLELLISTTTPYQIYATKDGLIDSDLILLNPIALTITEENSTTTTTTEPVHSSGGGFIQPEYKNLDIEKAIQYLNSKQTNGNFNSILYTDWAAIAFGAYNKNDATAEMIKNYLQTNPDTTAGFNNISDYARRVMALSALDINPYNVNGVNYIKKITDSFDGIQLGDPSIYNDDIFALVALAKNGYTANDDLIQKTVNFVLSKQTNNGWGSIDLTAAAIQALKNYSEILGVNEAIQQAATYLKSLQKDDGSFDNNVYSTAWAIQAGNTIGESSTNWIKKAQNYLAEKQSINGAIIDDIWATTQAIPPALNKSWADIMATFDRPASISNNVVNAGDTITTSENNTITSTIIINTSTTNTSVNTSTITTAKTEENINITSGTIIESTTAKSIPNTSTPITLEIKKQNKITNKVVFSSTTHNTSNIKTEKIENIANEIPNHADKKNIAKKVLVISSINTLALGLYLGLRLLKNMI